MVEKTIGIISVITSIFSSIFMLILLIGILVIIVVGRYTTWGTNIVNKYFATWLATIILLKPKTSTGPIGST